MGAQWIPLSVGAANLGELTLAREVIDLYVDGARGDPAAPYKKVALLAQIGAWEEVLALLRALPTYLPDPASYAYSRGTAALYLGESGEAREWLEKAVLLNPQAGSSWLSLALLVNFADEADLRDRIIGAEQGMARAPLNERGIYYYALGKAYADLGEHAAAFAAYATGAGIMKPLVPYSRERDRFTAADAVAGYDAGRIARLAEQQGEPTGRSIFVMGLPRSGTTLVEQILTSHSAVSDGAELYRLPLLVKDTGGLSFKAVEQFVLRGGAAAAARLWSHWLDERFPAPGRVVDKTLNTSRVLGLAATLLPEAPLVWLRRDPLDCAWSCFRSRFTGEAAWSHDLEDIAFHFRLEDDLLARWQEILGAKLLVVPLAGLTAEPERWTRTILTHCGLPEELQVFAPHENRRAVATTSVMQVRKPINRAGIGSAEPYREFLQPFLKAYYG